MPEHSPEPWVVVRRAANPEGSPPSVESLYVKDSGDIAILNQWYALPKNLDACEIDADRIVACVNACAGISTEALSLNAPFDAISGSRNIILTLVHVIEKYAKLPELEERIIDAAIKHLAILEGEDFNSTIHMQDDYRCNQKSGNWVSKARRKS